VSVPIRPENKHRYPPNWAEITRAIKVDRAQGRCECRGECGRPAYHLRADDGRCHNEHGKAAYGTGSKVVLTTAHLDHDPESADPERLRAFCQGCHLHYDRDHHSETRARTRREAIVASGQIDLFGVDADAKPLLPSRVGGSA
jgi:hypothetical protein